MGRSPLRMLHRRWAGLTLLLENSSSGATLTGMTWSPEVAPGLPQSQHTSPSSSRTWARRRRHRLPPILLTIDLPLMGGLTYGRDVSLGEGGPVGLFSRKEAAPAPVLGPDYFESNGEVMLGSGGLDMDAETDVVGEAEHRDLLVTLLGLADNSGNADWDAGRAEIPISLDAEEYRLAVLCAGRPVGYVEDDAAAKWLPRVREWQARDVDVLCTGFIVWDARRGDPRDDDSIPVGVRLDLVDQS
jgi:hypothetical protein